MEQSDLLRVVVSTLNDLGIAYFVTGSVAAMYYGEPRFTNDIHVVAKLNSSHISAFVARFPEKDFYLSRDAVERAVQRKSQFNIIHPESGLKVDVMVPANNEFNGSRFSRVVMVHPSSDYEAAFASPEDASSRSSSTTTKADLRSTFVTS